MLVAVSEKATVQSLCIHQVLHKPVHCGNAVCTQQQHVLRLVPPLQCWSSEGHAEGQTKAMLND